jgi:hypothetical protein
MSVIQVTLTKSTTPSPAGVTFASTTVVTTDASGASQTSNLTGSETPTPWSVSLTVAAGAGSITATDISTTGATIGTPVTQSYTTIATPTTFPATSGITVTTTTP